MEVAAEGATIDAQTAEPSAADETLEASGSEPEPEATLEDGTQAPENAETNPSLGAGLLGR